MREHCFPNQHGAMNFKLMSVVLCCLLGLGWFLSQPADNVLRPSKPDNSGTIANHTKPNATIQHSTNASAAGGVEQVDAQNRETNSSGRKQEIEEAFVEWSQQHGYEDYGKAYFYLSEAGLMGLADAGDIGAIQHLASLKIIKEPEEALLYFEKAAVLGSTSALVSITDVWALHANGKLAESMPSELTMYDSPQELLAIAYLHVAGLRGDKVTANGKISSFQGRIDSMSKEESESVCSTANRIYSDLETQRQSIGLPMLENIETPTYSTTNSVGDYFKCE